MEAAKMYFRLANGYCRPVDMTAAIAASDTIRSAASFNCLLGRDEFVFDLGHCSVATADAFINIVFEGSVMESLPDELDFETWIELLGLAHMIAPERIKFIAEFHVEILDYKIFLETAALIGADDMIKAVTRRGDPIDTAGMIDVFGELDLDTIMWIFDVCPVDQLIAGAILTRKSLAETRLLKKFYSCRYGVAKLLREASRSIFGR